MRAAGGLEYLPEGGKTGWRKRTFTIHFSLTEKKYQDHTTGEGFQTYRKPLEQSDLIYFVVCTYVTQIILPPPQNENNRQTFQNSASSRT